MKNRSTGHLSGFTLIELLVVVLIIGILAAVALPGYQKAVMRARYAQLPLFTRAIEEAGSRYFMANGEYASKIADLDLTFPGTLLQNGRLLSMGKYECQYIGPGEVSAASSLCFYYSGNADYGNLGYRIVRGESKHYCLAAGSLPKAKALCASMTAATPFDNGAGLLHYALN